MREGAALTDLDRTIAGLKGVHLMADGPYIGGIRPDGTKHVEPTWSTSDSKALELVDELTRPAAARMHDYAFSLTWDPGTKQWTAIFFRDGEVMFFLERAPTRPEAICRAYIAAVTWMRGRG